MGDRDQPEEDYTWLVLSEQHHSNIGGVCSELSLAFMDDPTLENYLKLRLANPGRLIEVWNINPFYWALCNRERVEALGINVEDVFGLIDADEACASRLSLRLIELIVERRAREKSGETHLVGRGEVISDSLINFLIAMMLDVFDWKNSLIIPRDLLVLVKHQLGADRSAEIRDMSVQLSRQKALSEGAYLKKMGKPVTLGSVAEILKVERSTVLRWFKDGDFQREVDRLYEMRKRLDRYEASRSPEGRTNESD